MPLEKRNALIERFNRNAAVADPGIPQLRGVPQSITNSMSKESKDISKDSTSIVKHHGDSFYILNKEDKNHSFKVVTNSSK